MAVGKCQKVQPNGNFILPKEMEQHIDVQKENGTIAKKLRELVDKDKAVLLAFIAPYVSVRISPIEERVASIQLLEEWGIEYSLSLMKKECADLSSHKLYLLVNSPGGVPPSCYNIAHMIQGCFPEIKVFVPQVALSGGALLALSGNEIVMSLASRLSPIDVQVSYADSRVSAYSMAKALSKLENYFSKKTVDEAPYPWRAMADKLDPIIFEDWNTSLAEIAGYAKEILEKAKYTPKQIEAILKTLVFTNKTHSYVIHSERAESIGLKISKNNDDYSKLNIMRKWVAQYAFTGSTKHIIRYMMPKESESSGNNKSKGSKKKETASKKSKANA